jgi:EAL domain-containing protein (putative c-di-GMP-specific phosphodiesterase class I)/FixJ family two-component response regulator
VEKKSGFGLVMGEHAADIRSFRQKMMQRPEVSSFMNSVPPRQLSVLVVDDKAFVRTMTGRILQSLGVEDISYAANGHEALALLRKEDAQVGLVLCDLMMPDMDGVEVVRHAAELKNKPPFVFISGANAALLGTAADTARARGLLVLGAIEKPISVEAVRGMLTKLDSVHASPRSAPRAVPLTAADLGRGLDRNQIILHYQPKVNLRTSEIEGFESLARWQHPEHGLVPPGQFIALAEESGIIEPLTDRVLLLALRQCAAWNAAGLNTKLSINISAHLLVDLRMPDRIARDVLRHGVEPKQIVLEITETGVFRDTADTLDILARLHMKGFALSIDDFGTGYSSMEQLRRVPFGELKIDRAFVNGAAQNVKARAILQSSAHLGKSLGLSVVAEGAETQEDWDLLGSLGLDLVQGYYVSRPLAADAVSDWSAKWMRAH